MSDISDYQVDHLLLLIGSNPLPNAVAGKLLVAAGGTITFICSQGSLALAERLGEWLRDADVSEARINYTRVEESDADSVYNNVYNALDAYESKFGNAKHTGKGRVGLHYTGGTKVMSVHAYRAVQNWAGAHHREPVFSYLDAHSLHMCFDPAPGRNGLSLSVGRKVDISINDLLTLHNWDLHTDPLKKPILPRSAAALLTVHCNDTDAEVWRKWLEDELFPKTKQQAPKDDWKSNAELRKVSIMWPDLPALRESMSNELGLADVENFILTAGVRREPSWCVSEKAFGKWLSGEWLESAVLSVLRHISKTVHLTECCMDLKVPVISDKGFQFDVAAIRGYQLFAFSCTTDSGQKNRGGSRALLKQKLFEVSIRARQMGGDEACAALICCASQKDADELEQEVRSTMNQGGRIRVFGREQLADLPRHITDWIRSQSKEE